MQFRIPCKDVYPEVETAGKVCYWPYLSVAVQTRAAGGEELAWVCRDSNDRTGILPEGCLALKCVCFASCYISCGDMFQHLNKQTSITSKNELIKPHS